MGTKMKIQVRHCLWLIPLCLIPASLSTQDFLFFVSQGDSIHGPGIYGGPVDFRQNGQITTDMYMYGYNCVYYENEALRDVEIDWFDIDEQSGHLLFRPFSKLGLFTIARGPICHKRPHCRNDTQEALFYESQLQLDNSVSAIGYHHGNTYILYNDVSRSGNDNKVKVQIRKLKGCESEYPITSSSTLTVGGCSELVATVKEDNYDRAPHFKALDNLVVYGSSDNPSFLFLLQESEIKDRVRSKVDVALVHVSSGGEVSYLHWRNIEQLDYFQLQLRGLGGVSLKNDLVCWAAVDAVLCGDLTTEGGRVIIDNVKVAMPSAQVAGVCQAEGEPHLANVVTGVAIAETETELAFFFGCVSQTKGFGGAGLMRMPKGSQSGTVYAMKNGTSLLYAGQMQLTNHCHYHPSQDKIEVTATGSDVRPTHFLWLAALWSFAYYLH